MFKELQVSVLSKFTKFTTKHITISSNRTRMIVEQEWEVAGRGKTATISYIYIIGDDKELTKNKWVITRCLAPREGKVWNPMTVLSDKTKDELMEFMKNQKDKITKENWGDVS